jgi:hypothetical protein
MNEILVVDDEPGDQRGDRECRCPPPLPPGVAQIGPGVLHQIPAPYLARAFLEQRVVAELAMCRMNRLLARHAAGHQLVDLLVEVLPDLLGQIAFEPAAVEQPAQHVHGFTGARTSRMPSSMRSKLLTSRWSRVLPPGVIA